MGVRVEASVGWAGRIVMGIFVLVPCYFLLVFCVFFSLQSKK